jgi:hypothetical protein
MTTLSLNKKFKGYYTKKVNDITITISNAYIQCGIGCGKDWQLVIENSKDIVVSTFFPSKKDAYKYATKWVIENM